MQSRLANSSQRLARLASPSPRLAQPSNRRTLFGWGKKDKFKDVPKPVLTQDNLFHPLSQSPFPEMRAKGERIKQLAYCPVSLDKYGEKVHVAYECPDCGFPTHASEERWAEDENHGRYWPRLREANEDEHDLRSGREMTEFRLPGEQEYEQAVSMGNWDVFLYTRGFPSIDTERARRHVSKLLTYPITIGSVLHENSPYTIRNQRLLPEGLRSLLALRRTLHPVVKNDAAAAGLPPSPLRIFILGARAESSLPPRVLAQISHLFPAVPLHIVFIGPESYIPPSSSKSSDDDAQKGVYGVPSHTRIEHDGKLTITSLRCGYSDVHDVLGPFDPYQDVFFAFSPGFGFPDEHDPLKTQLETNWHSAVLSILETKCALFCTGFSPADIERDVVALDKVEGIRGEFDWLLTPGENVFGSEKWEIAEFDPRVAVKTNWGVWGIRGKRYEVRGETIETP
ncbi:Protein MSS51, mitochondrial [Rhodotorula toruloides]|uniref:BY PROTMAP: gi/472587604/gb/EMS25100.1/ mRNA processing-related protein [Rhodosporidium toruloides NP11] gi/647398653/emb/CDR42756.1/ RHTO0S07e03796g1_1 [Rhodosporidium toruloides] n=1 Tax=Rhodotorula toruloides TaxID=5286 RepID=A0A0K3CDQ3_RHOTO|nr:Protein MSS51, mitochondrial [Rhodotorula toruloides]PRQ73639.1 Zinc-finger of mitochondrial splicing suppressor 51-domain containing protein [Rhodotorula toruloides]